MKYLHKASNKSVRNALSTSPTGTTCLTQPPGKAA